MICSSVCRLLPIPDSFPRAEDSHNDVASFRGPGQLAPTPQSKLEHFVGKDLGNELQLGHDIDQRQLRRVSPSEGERSIEQMLRNRSVLQAGNEQDVAKTLHIASLRDSEQATQSSFASGHLRLAEPSYTPEMGYLPAPDGSSLLTAKGEKADRAVPRRSRDLVLRTLAVVATVSSVVLPLPVGSLADGLAPARHR